MLAGHYAASFIAKTADPKVPLWVLLGAAQFVDIIWCLLVLVGVESFHLDATLPSNPLVADYMPFSHSLVANAVWAGFAAAAVWVWLRSWRSALVVGLVVLAHWFFDLPLHRNDLTIFGGEEKLGGSLWDFPILAHGLEFLVLGLSVVGYLLIRRPAAGQRRAALILVAVLFSVQIYAVVAPPPQTNLAMILSLLTTYVGMIGLAAWLERRPRHDIS